MSGRARGKRDQLAVLLRNVEEACRNGVLRKNWRLTGDRLAVATVLN